jgi:hypothetical protein
VTDPMESLARADVNALLDRADIEEAMRRVDVGAVRADVPVPSAAGEASRASSGDR